MKLTVFSLCVLLLLPSVTLTAQEATPDRDNRAQAQQQTEQPRQQRPRRAANQRLGNQRRPTHPNVHYGKDQRQVMDVWLAASDKPTPLLVSIHGGGFRSGNKSVAPEVLKACLDSGISVAAITYRLSNTAKAPAQFHDAARAIQFLRHNAKEWSLDPSRIACIGSSAGAGLSLWLGFHDDLAQADSDDPVLRQSSRITCASVYNGQSSYDPRVIRDLFPGTDTYRHQALAQLYDIDIDNLDNLPEEKYRLFEETSALPHLTRDDVPVLMVYASRYETPIRNVGIGIHHPKFGQVLKEQMDKLDIPCQVHVGSDRGEWHRLTVDFVKQQFERSEQ